MYIFLLHSLTNGIPLFFIVSHTTMITLQNTGSNITLQTIAASGFCLDVVILLPASQLRDIFSMIVTILRTNSLRWKNENQTFKILVITDSLYPGYMIDIDNFGSHWGLLYWLTGQLKVCGAVTGSQASTLGSTGSGKKGMRSATFFSGIRCIQIEHPLNGWKNWMKLFHRQNKSYLSVFPQCALTCALMSHGCHQGRAVN